MLVPVVAALVADDVVDVGLDAEVAAVVAAAGETLPAFEMESWILPKPMAKLAAEELALLQ
jgi:hypothetical protein